MSRRPNPSLHPASHRKDPPVHEKPTENWTLYTADDDEGPSMWQLRESYPSDLNCSDFPTSVVIEWTYADGGSPEKQVLDELHEFETLLDPLNDARGNSLLVHIIRGNGVSELCYYCRDCGMFMEQLNVALAGKPPCPIEILHDSDPTWHYCRQTKQELGAVDD